MRRCNKSFTTPKHFGPLLKIKEKVAVHFQHKCLTTIKSHQAEGISVVICLEKILQVRLLPQQITLISRTLTILSLTSMALCNLEFDTKHISRELIALDETKSAGSDGIPPLVIKRCAKALVSPYKLFLIDPYATVCLKKRL